MHFGHPEFSSDPSLSSRFEVILGTKFEGGARLDNSRQHEECVRMLPVRPLQECPDAGVVFVTRPILSQEEQARRLWQQWGGYRVNVHESTPGKQTEWGTTPASSVQTTYFAIGDSLYRRRIHSTPGECYMAPIEALDPEAVTDLLDWIETGLVDPFTAS